MVYLVASNCTDYVALTGVEMTYVKVPSWESYISQGSV